MTMKILSIGAVLLALGTGTSWAGIAACSGTQLLSSFGNPGAATDGCFQTDVNFDNFAVSTTGNTGNTGDPALTNVNLAASGGTISGSGASSTITQIAAVFTSTDSSDSTQWVGTGGSETLVSNVSYQAHAAQSEPTPATWEITSLTLALGSFTTSNPANAGNTIEVKEQFCVGASTFSCTSASTDYGYIEELVTLKTTGSPTIADSVCYNNGATSCTATTSLTLSGLDATSIAIEDSVSITRVSNAGVDIFLTGFTNDINQNAELPEPSTLVLMGTALAGIGILRRRRQKV